MQQILSKYLTGIILLFGGQICAAQGYWQQKVKYTMDADMDVQTNILNGRQKLVYTNSSPDTLRRVFYHLYWNAFQPNSMMDVHNSNRNGSVVGDRISKLKDDERGWIKIQSLRMNGRNQVFIEHETILEVMLSEPILPKGTVILDVNFESHVPRLIRRAGAGGLRSSDYSMAQWYPKLCEYDIYGWHPTPYVGTEFYGVWGDFDVTIHIDSNYTLAGTGYLQSQRKPQITRSDKKGEKIDGSKRSWHFNAPNVHDFMWAASTKYKLVKRRLSNGVDICVYYRNDTTLVQTMFNHDSQARERWKGNFDQYYKNYVQEWEHLADAAEIVFPFIERTFGKYPYKQYSFIAGGDGGMEYPMATLIATSRLSTAIHELMHSWYQGVIGTNESKYPWMDEGFTKYAEGRVMQYYDSVMNSNTVTSGSGKKKIGYLSNDRYIGFAKSKFEEPLTTHADHFDFDGGYIASSYAKGMTFLEQLGYVVGSSVRDQILREYYRVWQFKHPGPDDFIHVAERVSGMKLDWYQEYFVNTTKTIDYGIDSVWMEGAGTQVRLRNYGKMPMPQDILVTYKDGKQEMVYIPMYLMFGSKPVEDTSITRTELEPWKWTHPTYTFKLDRSISDIKFIEIDPSQRMADVERKNNKKEFK